MSGLQIIRWMYPNKSGSGFTFIPKSTDNSGSNNQYFSELATRIRSFDTTINYDLPRLLHGHLKERLNKAKKLQANLLNKYMIGIERFLTLSANNENKALNDEPFRAVQRELDYFFKDLSVWLCDLESKAQFIHKLDIQRIVYYNVPENGSNLVDYMTFLEHKFMNNKQSVRVIMSNDSLSDNSRSRFNQILNKVLRERQNNSNLSVIYTDFTYCSCRLANILVLPPMQHTNRQVSFNFSKQKSPPLSPKVSAEDCINILLLGATGVGKSTFINAFVNYLKFDTFKQAQSSQTTVLIPALFSVTTGNDFQERVVKSGGVENSENENFNHSGHSVTQHCRSYVFDLHHSIGKTLRIIDTPGFGDRRGSDQDHMNMERILDYIRDLTHLNAVCCLLKPNLEKMHDSFQTCLKQLCTALGHAICPNIIFCFTNTRPAHYTSGHTTQLLSSILHSLSMPGVSCRKENTFCFDNESFRCLVALKNGIHFNDKENQDYATSWLKSVDETNRLLNYICAQLNSCSLQNLKLSLKHFQVEISKMIRPILETMRNILRNMILQKTNVSKSIKLCPQAVRRSSMFCNECKRSPVQIENFWILPDKVHEFESQCDTCSCSSRQHSEVDYMLNYEVSLISSTYYNQDLNNFLNRLMMICLEFGHFLINVAHSTAEDPFLIGLLRIIDDEKRICNEQPQNALNLELVKDLEKLVILYKGQMKKVKLSQHCKDIVAIKELVDITCEYEVIYEQMAAIHKKSEANKSIQHEFHILENFFTENIYLSTPC